MTLKQSIKRTAQTFAAGVVFVLLNSAPAFAIAQPVGLTQVAQQPAASTSAGTTAAPTSFYPEDKSGMSAVSGWLKTFINLFSAVIGVGAVIMIIFAGIQYSAARDNPQAIQSAKQKIYNVLIGLGAFIFLWAFLQWLIPGGAF